MAHYWRCYKLKLPSEIIGGVDFGPAPTFVWFNENEAPPANALITGIGQVKRNERPKPTGSREAAREEAERVIHKGGLDWEEISFSEALDWAANRKVNTVDPRAEAPDFGAQVAMFEDGSAVAVRSEYWSSESDGDREPPTFWRGV